MESPQGAPAEPQRVEDVPLSVEEVRRRAAVGGALLAVRGVGIRLILLVGNLVVARLMLPSEIGLVAIGASLVMLGDYLANSGVGAPLIRRRVAPERADLQSVVGLQLALTSAVVAVVAAVGIPLGTGGALAAIMVASLPVMTLRTPTIVTLERNLSYRTLVIVELLDAVVYVAWAITTIELGWGVWGLATAVVARALIGTSVLLVLSPLVFLRPRLDWDRLRPILGFGARFQAIGALAVVRDQGFNFAIAAVAGLTLLGLWTLVYRVLQTLLVVFEGLWRVSFPAMSRLAAAGEDPKPIIERGIGVVALGSGAFLATLAACGPALIPSVVGSNWEDAADILPGACLGLMIVGPISVCVAGYLFAQGDAGTPLRGAVLHTAAQFAVALPLMPALGGWAIGLGGVAAGIVEAFVLGREAARRSGARVLRPLVAPLLAATIAATAGWLVATTNDPTFGTAVASGALAAGLYLAAMALFRRALLVDLLRIARRGVSRPAPA